MHNEHEWNVHWVPLAKYKDETEIVRCEPVLIVTELFNIAINNFGVKESARSNRTRYKQDPVYCTHYLEV